MTSPTAPARPWRRLRATSLRAKPRSAMTACTRAAVAACTPGSRLTTRETVLRLTPAVLATSRMVGRLTGCSLLRSVDNVVNARRGETYCALTTLSTGERGQSPGERQRALGIQR